MLYNNRANNVFIYAMFRPLDKIKIEQNSFKGPQHKKNEDKTLVIRNKKYILVFIFDGVSSAERALEGINVAEKFITSNHESYFAINGDYRLSELMRRTNEEVLRYYKNDACSTYCAIFISANAEAIKISSMGDSRIYGISRQYITQYTEDDKVPGYKNVLSKCLGMPNLNADDFWEKDIIPKEYRILLCTDGFYSFLEENKKDFHEILNFKKISNIKKALLKKIKNKNVDDSTFVIMDIYDV